MALFGKHVIRKAIGQGKTTVLATRNGAGPLTARAIFSAAQSGDAVAQSIIRTTDTRLGEVMAILIDVLNPECIVIEGLALRMGDALLEPGREVLKRKALAESREACRITAAGLGEQIGDVAAICMAMGELNERQ